MSYCKGANNIPYYAPLTNRKLPSLYYGFHLRQKPYSIMLSVKKVVFGF